MTTRRKFPNPITAGELLDRPEEPPLMCHCGHSEGMHEAQHCCMCHCARFVSDDRPMTPRDILDVVGWEIDHGSSSIKRTPREVPDDVLRRIFEEKP